MVTLNASFDEQGIFFL